MNTSARKGEKNIILFDGTCRMCNGVVDFIVRHNKIDQFSFIPFESGKATEYLIRFESQGLNKGSVALIRDEKIYLKSDAVLHIFRCLEGFWPILYILIIFPRFLRDPVYNFVARHRYKIF